MVRNGRERIAKSYTLELLQWKLKKFVKGIISPIDDDDDKPPEKPVANTKASKRDSSLHEMFEELKKPSREKELEDYESSERIPVSKPINHNSGGGLPSEAFAIAMIKVTCVLVIGIVILNSIMSSIQIPANDTAMTSLMHGIESSMATGYVLAALMVLALSAGVLMHMLGFM